MIVDNKARVIGKVISLNSDRFSVELLGGIKNFNANGFDDVHYFAQINSYVIIPYQDYSIVAEVINVREKDVANYAPPKEQELNKAYSVKYLDVFPVGTIKHHKFSFGVSVYPTLYSDVLYIKDSELDLIFGSADSTQPISDDSKSPTKLISLDIGKSVIFPDYSIKVNIDHFFGSHSAVLGNTGSGKSCTIASMLQTLYKKEDFSAVGSSFVVLDVNGEYEQAFIPIPNSNINTKQYQIHNTQGNSFHLPHYFLKNDEWEMLLQASEKAQQPILRNALGLATLFSSNSTSGQNIQLVKNHILASCILAKFHSGESPVSTYQHIQGLLRKGAFEDGIDAGYNSQYGNFPQSGNQEREFLDKIQNHISDTELEIPDFNNLPFEFDELEEYIEMAILYEESHGNKQVRDYCSSLITRLKTLKNRPDLDFIKQPKVNTNEKDFISNLLGISQNKKTNQIAIINLDSIDDEIVEVVSSVLTRLIFDRLKRIGDRNTFPVNLILEEAHRYISNEKQRNFIRANKIFERVAKEGRKYGLFLLISSQRPSELSKTVLSQCNNFIVHRIQNPDDLSHIRQITPHISEATLKKLPSIPKQNALVFGSAVKIPALFEVNTASPTPKSADNEISKNWFIEPDKSFTL